MLSATEPRSSQSPVLRLSRESRAGGVLSEFWELAAETSAPASLADLRRLGALYAAETAVKILQAVKQESYSFSATDDVEHSQQRSYTAATLFSLALQDVLFRFGDGFVGEDAVTSLRAIQTQCCVAFLKVEEESTQAADAERLHRLDLQLLGPIVDIIKQTASSPGSGTQRHVRDLLIMCSKLLMTPLLERNQLNGIWIFSKGAAHICQLAKRWYQEEGDMWEAAELLRLLMVLQNQAEDSAGISRAAFFVRLSLWDVLQEWFLDQDPSEKDTEEEQRACMRKCQIIGSLLLEILNGTDNLAVTPLASYLWVQFRWHLPSPKAGYRYPDETGLAHFSQIVELLTPVMKIRGLVPQEGDSMEASDMFAIAIHADSLADSQQDEAGLKHHLSRLMVPLVNAYQTSEEPGTGLVGLHARHLLPGLVIGCRCHGGRAKVPFSEVIRKTADFAATGAVNEWLLTQRSGLETWRDLVSMLGEGKPPHHFAIEVSLLLTAIFAAIVEQPPQSFSPATQEQFENMVKEARPALIHTLILALKKLESETASESVDRAFDALIGVYTMHNMYCSDVVPEASTAEMNHLQSIAGQALRLAATGGGDDLAWARYHFAAAALAHIVHAEIGDVGKMPDPHINDSIDCEIIWKYSLKQTEWVARQLPALDLESLRSSAHNSRYPRLPTGLPPVHASYVIRTGILAASTTCLLTWRPELQCSGLAVAQEDTVRFVSLMLQCIGICLGMCDPGLWKPPHSGSPVSNTACMHYASHISGALVRLATIGPPQDRPAAFERLVEYFDLADKLLWDSRNLLLSDRLFMSIVLPYMLVSSAFGWALKQLPELRFRCRDPIRLWRFILEDVMPVAARNSSILQQLRENIMESGLTSLLLQLPDTDKKALTEAEKAALLVEEQAKADAVMAALLAEEEAKAEREAAKKAKKRGKATKKRRGEKVPDALLNQQAADEPSATATMSHSYAEDPQNLAESCSPSSEATEGSSSRLENAQLLEGGLLTAAVDETLSDEDGWQPSPAGRRISNSARKGIPAAQRLLPPRQAYSQQPLTTPQRVNKRAAASSSGAARELASSMQSLSLAPGQGLGPVADSASTDPQGWQAIGQQAGRRGSQPLTSRAAGISSRVKALTPDRGRPPQLKGAASAEKLQTARSEPLEEPASSSKLREGAAGSGLRGSSRSSRGRIAAELEEIFGMRATSASSAQASRPAAPVSPSPARALHRPAPSSGRLHSPAASQQQLRAPTGGIGLDSSAANSEHIDHVRVASSKGPGSAATATDAEGQLPGLQPSFQPPAAEGGMSANQLEEFYTCPITQEVMSDPVIATDGFTYERSAIEAWLQKSGDSPMTGAPLRSAELQPNLLVKQMIRALYHH